MKWVDADDDKGMSFQGLQQNTFTLQMCFPYCREKTGVSNPQTAGKYFVAIVFRALSEFTDVELPSWSSMWPLTPLWKFWDQR